MERLKAEQEMLQKEVDDKKKKEIEEKINELKNKVAAKKEAERLEAKKQE